MENKDKIQVKTGPIPHIPPPHPVIPPHVEPVTPHPFVPPEPHVDPRPFEPHPDHREMPDDFHCEGHEGDEMWRRREWDRLEQERLHDEEMRRRLAESKGVTPAHKFVSTIYSEKPGFNLPNN